MNQERKFHRFLASVGEAVFDDAHWSVASRLIDELCGLKGNNLILGKVFPDDHRQVLFARFFYRGDAAQSGNGDITRSTTPETHACRGFAHCRTARYFTSRTSTQGRS